MFGDLVRAQRQRLGLTQEQLGERAMLSVRSIGKIESGRIAAPRLRTIHLLADTFGLTDGERDHFLRVALSARSPRSSSVVIPPFGHVRAVPAQLPADVRAFTGRGAELARLDELLAERTVSTGEVQEGTDSVVAIAVVSGTAGVGKTALAVHWAHRVRRHFPDGQLYVNLRGYDPDQPMAAAETLNTFLAALGVPRQEIPLDDGERASRYRTELAERHLLVILDNASSVEQVRPLLPGTSSCVVLVTSRDSLPGLVARDGAERIELELLPANDAHVLLRRLVGTRADEAPATVAALARLCARLPLALRVAAELAVARPGTPLHDLAVELTDQRRLLDLLDAGGDPRAGVRAVFSWSVRNLPIEPKRIFPLLGLHPGPTFDLHAVAALAHIGLADADAVLTLLTRAHLVQRTESDRCALHDLLRAYAVQLGREAVAPSPLAVEDGRTTGDERRAATGRLLDHYLHTAFAADRLLNPHRRPITLPSARAGATAASFEDYAAALTWFRAEADTIMAATRFALYNGWLVHAWQLPWAMVNFLHLQGRWADWVSLYQNALVAARRLADRDAEARSLHTLARGQNEAGHPELALVNYRDALALYRAAGELNGQANSLNGLSGSCLRLGQPHDALTHAHEAIDIYAALADRTGQASTLNLLGRVHSALGNRRLAVTSHRRALALFHEAEDTYGQAKALDALGDSLRRLGRTAQAAACHGRSIGLHETLGNRACLAVSHQRLAEALCALGHRDAAEVHSDRALSIFNELEQSNLNRINSQV
jgi:tetratricopeptide (TPR) repeat protein/transcriptional regulator with XRE-family HTH domain